MAYKAAILATIGLLSAKSLAQKAGTLIPEVHPKLTTLTCTKKEGCRAQDTAVVIDQLQRNTHLVGNPDVSCGNEGQGLNSTVCPDAKHCFNNCEMEGVNYTARGVATNGDALTLNLFVKSTNGSVIKASPRVYLMAEGGKDYKILQLRGREISYDADVSKLACGTNGALYLSEMSKTGGRNKYNPTGAKYGTGYCDAQCKKLPWINGVANINATHGACCSEMDLWEANSAATVYTPHVCNTTGVFECEGALCEKDGVCDRDGCGLNPYRSDPSFYGPNLTVNTKRPFKVVTQFLTSDNTTKGELKEIRRLYVQDGQVIQNAAFKLDNNVTGSSVNDAFCNATASKFQQQGGLPGMGDALARGMALVFSIWDDESGQNLSWLDADGAGPCNATEGDPATIQAKYPDAAVTFSNIRWGDLGRTYNTWNL